MTVRTMPRRHHHRLAGTVACLVLAGGMTTGCGSELTATAIPDGDDAAAYVSAKFADTLTTLSEDFQGIEDRASTTDKYARVDDQWMDSTITAVQVGRPPARVSKNHSNKDSTEYLDVFHPAGSPVEYLLLGPAYESLAPTPWVSTPHTGGQYGPCAWEGYRDVCAMLSAVDQAVEQGDATKQAKSLPGGAVELIAEVPLGVFLENRVIIFPDRLLKKVTEKMKSEVIDTRIGLDGAGKLRTIEMNGTVTGESRFEVRMKYQVQQEPPTETDLPKVPEKDKVTVLPDRAAVRDFYDRMGELQEGG
ncbi:hypothetical protein [Amycolatopsis cihanbeyliensis]|uniref:Lipoprotein n=1 Tax=Amycolatopsis cihanbeyliensis TaxID=1128664 RepID=A0A542DJ76_AMYCI|nr:hypothetical protein [Amycolatopsis cihanbeyliensis]TQJ03143.1 hypothetical protein FB471_2893 [Amycolatopsis cihanbeyliensis]